MEVVESGEEGETSHGHRQIASISGPRTVPRNDHHSYAETSDTDPGVDITEKHALPAHPPLAWITSDMQKITSRRVIRSQIMLDYRHKHRLAQSRSRRMPAAELVPLVARQPSRASDSSCEPNYSLVAKREKHQTQNKNLEAPENYNLNDVDLYMGNMNLKYSQITLPRLDEWSTFTTLYSPVSLRMRGHLHYFVNVIVASQKIIRSGALIGLQEFWPTLAQSNPDLLHAIIALSACNQAVRDAEVICGDQQNLLQENNLKPNSTDYFFHQAESIRLINEKLSDPAQACSDATLGAVTLLICSDMATGQLDKVEIHWKGLQRMINLRGSFDSLPFFVWSLVELIDVKFALVGATDPVYPAVLKVSGNYPDLGTESDLSIIGNRCLNLEGAPDSFHNELNSVIRHLSDITRHVECHRRGRNQDNNSCEFEAEQRTHIERRLLSITFNHRHSHIGNNSIEECCRLAMLLFVNTVLWDGCSQSTTIIRSLVVQLKTALKSTDLKSFYCSYLDMFIWILFLGGTSSAEPLERAWFVSQLASATSLRGLAHWKDVRESLLGFFYLDSAHQDTFQVMWAEVVESGRTILN